MRILNLNVLKMGILKMTVLVQMDTAYTGLDRCCIEAAHIVPTFPGFLAILPCVHVNGVTAWL